MAVLQLKWQCHDSTPSESNIHMLESFRIYFHLWKYLQVQKTPGCHWPGVKLALRSQNVFLIFYICFLIKFKDAVLHNFWHGFFIIQTHLSYSKCHGLNFLRRGSRFYRYFSVIFMLKIYHVYLAVLLTPCCKSSSDWHCQSDFTVSNFIWNCGVRVVYVMTFGSFWSDSQIQK